MSAVTIIRDYATERRRRREEQKRRIAFDNAGVFGGRYVRCNKCGQAGHCTLYARKNPRRLIVTCGCGNRAEYTRQSSAGTRSAP